MGRCGDRTKVPGFMRIHRAGWGERSIPLNPRGRSRRRPASPSARLLAWVLAHDLPRRLVVAETLVARLTQLAVASPLGERHLGDELGLRPARVTRRIARLERRTVALATLERSPQALERLFIESRSDLSRVP